MGTIADAFNAAFTPGVPPDMDQVAALGQVIEDFMMARTVFDLPGMPTTADLVGKAGWRLVVNATEDGYELAP